MNSNTITIIIATIVIMGGAYWYFFTGTGDQPPVSATSTTGNTAQSQFQALVNELQPISFSTAIFDDSRFAALVDLTTPIEPEAGGRIDPFAPVTNALSTTTTVKKMTGR